MIANPAIPYPGGVPHTFTLNDLRVHSTVAEEPSPTSPLTLYGAVLAIVLAIGAFVWLDPLRLFTPTEATPPAPALVPSTQPALPTERQEIIAPLAPVPATKSVEVPIAPALVTRAPRVPASAVPLRGASIKPESRGNPMNKTNTTVPQAGPSEKAAPPALLAKPEEQTAPPALVAKPEEQTAQPVLQTKPEEKTDVPIVPKLGDDTKAAPKPAATNDEAPVTE
jgi:hypothetical protein